MEYNMAEYNDGYMSHILFLQEEYNSNFTKTIVIYAVINLQAKNKEEIRMIFCVLSLMKRMMILHVKNYGIMWKKLKMINI